MVEQNCTARFQLILVHKWENGDIMLRPNTGKETFVKTQNLKKFQNIFHHKTGQFHPWTLWTRLHDCHQWSPPSCQQTKGFPSDHPPRTKHKDIAVWSDHLDKQYNISMKWNWQDHGYNNWPWFVPLHFSPLGASASPGHMFVKVMTINKNSDSTALKYSQYIIEVLPLYILQPDCWWIPPPSADNPWSSPPSTTSVDTRIGRIQRH